MSRRPEPTIQPALNAALRLALRQAADSIEPADNGLDKIRTKIVARQSGTSWHRWSRRAIGWRPDRAWLSGLIAAVIERFRRDPSRIGWLGWLRPAAAAATGLFVVTAASWAVAALPGAITSSSEGRPIRTFTGSPTHHPTTSTMPYSTGPGGVVVGPSTPGGYAWHAKLLADAVWLAKPVDQSERQPDRYRQPEPVRQPD